MLLIHCNDHAWFSSQSHPSGRWLFESAVEYEGKKIEKTFSSNNFKISTIPDSKPDCFDLSDEFQCRKIEPGPSYQVNLLLTFKSFFFASSLVSFQSRMLNFSSFWDELLSAVHLPAAHQQHRQDHHRRLRRHNVNSWHQRNFFNLSGSVHPILTGEKTFSFQTFHNHVNFLVVNCCRKYVTIWDQ